MTDSATTTGARPTGVHRSLVTSAGWVAASHVAAQAFAYGSLIYLARVVSPTDYGTVAIGTTVVYTAALAVDHGSHGGLVVRSRVSPAHLVRVAMLCLTIALVAAVTMTALARPLVAVFAKGGNVAAFAALSLCLPLYALALVPTALLQRAMAFGRLAALTAAANVITAAAAVAAGVAGLGVWALVVRLVGQFGLLAVLTALCCRESVHEAVNSPRPPGGSHVRGGGERWFFLFLAAFMLTMNLDNLVIGAFSDAALVGLYALAFAIAMSPCTQFGEQVGRVLFAAAAASPQTTGEQAEKSIALMSMLLLPALPAGIVLAPVLLPALLGPQWTPVVAVFQILLVAGVGMAIVNCVGEALAGAGHIAFRAKVMVARCVALLIALLALVGISGITGAAVAQLVVFIPYALMYCTRGARMLGTSARALWHRIAPAAWVFALQTIVTSAAVLALRAAGASEATAAGIAVAGGLAVALPWGIRSTVRGWRS